MKKKLFMVIAMLSIISLSGLVSINFVTDKEEKDSSKIRVVTSFYPVYIAALNVVNDCDNVILVNLTEPKTGCLHDYQLTPQDLITLEMADVFIINGGGIESFIQDVAKQYPNLTIIDSSEGIDFLENSHEEVDEHAKMEEHESEHYHEEDAHEEDSHEEDSYEEDVHQEDDHDLHDHGEINAHIWMDITKYIEQVKNIESALSNLDKNHALEYAKNTNDYLDNLLKLNQEAKDLSNNLEERQVIIFHDSFAYLCNELGINIRHTVNMDSESSLGAKEIKEVIEDINNYNIKTLLVEEQYGDKIAQTISKETNSRVFILDSLVTGEYNKDSYINGMRKNLDILKEALK